MYIVIEKHGGPEYAAIVTDQNEDNLLFDTSEEAQEYVELCQNGVMVELN